MPEFKRELLKEVDYEYIENRINFANYIDIIKMVGGYVVLAGGGVSSMLLTEMVIEGY